MNTLVAFLTALIRQISPNKNRQSAKAKVEALVAKLDQDATVAYKSAEGLTYLAGEVLRSAGIQRTYAAEAKGLAGKLEAAVQ